MVSRDARVPGDPLPRHERSEWRGQRGGCASERPTRAGTGPAAARPLPQTLARDDDADGRAFSRLALHFAKPSQKCHTLAHSKKSEVPRAHAGFAPLLG